MANREPTLENHEDRIVVLEGSVKEVQDDIRVIHEDLKERYARIDEGNKHLRELSQSQIIQNTKILDSVLAGNHDAAKRQDELKAAALKTRSELWLKAIGSGGVFYLIVDMLLRLLK